MITKLVPMGNARGVRLPKALLEGCGIQDEVQLDLADGALVLRPHKPARTGWSAAFRKMARAKDDRLLEPATETVFDRSEWRW